MHRRPGTIMSCAFLVLNVSVFGLPGSQPSPQMPPLKPTHAIRGFVMSMGPSDLVIGLYGRHGGKMLFLVTPRTHREGLLQIGSTVSIRYRVDAGHLLATAVSSNPERLQPPLRP
jgi:hypothetical protein